MRYSKEFKEFLGDCSKHNQYVGLGNPDAKILFIGKESGMEVGKEHIHGSAKSLFQTDYSNRYIPLINSKLRHKGHTWQKYQTLYDLISSKLKIELKPKDDKKYEITFVENVFATELSNLAAPRTNIAKSISGFSTNLKERKKTFWSSNFIKRFPVILIFASDNNYIETYKGEVCEIFGVKFIKEIPISKNVKIWLHFAI